MTALCRAIKVTPQTPQLQFISVSTLQKSTVLTHFQLAFLHLPYPLLKQQLHFNSAALVSVRYRSPGLLSVAVKGHFCTPLNASMHTNMSGKKEPSIVLRLCLDSCFALSHRKSKFCTKAWQCSPHAGLPGDLRISQPCILVLVTRAASCVDQALPGCTWNSHCLDHSPMW